MEKKRPIWLLFIVTALFIVAACEKNDPSDQFCDNSLQFDIDEFVEGVISDMESQNISGYQFVVNNDGTLYHSNAFGLARHENDPNGPIDMTVNTRLNVASVSKFIGAIALMIAMEERNVSLEFNVVNYLPESWRDTIHPDFRDVDSPHYLTFKKLLRMESSIDFIGSTPRPGDMLSEADMLTSLIRPPNANRDGIYQNANFTLIRVLIGEFFFQLDENNEDYDTICTDAYFKFLEERIFKPLNINPPDTADEINDYYNSPTYAMAYQWPFNESFQDASDGSLGWLHTSDPYLNGGSGGLVLSSMDLATILAFFKNDPQERLISNTQRDKIIAGELGLFETTLDGTYGVYLSKGGTRGPDGRTANGNCCDRAVRSRIMMFPNGVEAVLLTNSNHTSLGTVLRSNFDSAWKSGCNP